MTLPITLVLLPNAAKVLVAGTPVRVFRGHRAEARARLLQARLLAAVLAASEQRWTS